MDKSDGSVAVRLIVLVVFLAVCLVTFGAEGSANEAAICQYNAGQLGYGNLETRIHWGDCQVDAGVLPNGKHVWKNLESMPKKSYQP